MKINRAKLPGPIAVIDAGAHSIRLEIVQQSRDGELETLESLTYPVPFGRDVFVKGSVSPENILLTSKILTDFSAKMKEYGVTRHKAIATSAIREATNRDLFLSTVKNVSGIDLEVLEAPEEIRLIYLAVKNAFSGRINLENKSALLCIIGTGATHICTILNGRLKSSETLRIGTLRIYEEIGQSLSLKKSVDIVDTFTARAVETVVKHHFEDRPPDIFIAAGASVRMLANIENKGMTEEVLSSISRKKLKSLNDIATGNAPEKLVEKYGISDSIAQSLAPCSEILENFFEITKADKLIVPSVSTRDAIIEEFLRDIGGDADPFVSDMISSAEFLGEKYKSDREHSNNVTANSLRLFDELKDIHWIPDRGRLLLQIAAILHDIGQFVNNRQHHKHACYLIANSPLPGITPRELNVIAATARYHRRGKPKTSHPEYMSLLPEDRVLVSKLAAILRVADSLDHSNVQRITSFDVEYDESNVKIIVKGSYDLTIEQLELKKRGDLFADVFGRKVKLS